jgi:UDP-3-O-[3-hydroxymyristoyl] glucosamine N-acyltransferase
MWQLEELAELVDGTLQATTDVSIHGAASMSNVQTNEITFVTSQKYLDQFESGPAAAAVISADLKPSKPCILVNNPESAFATIVKLFRPTVERQKIGISPAACVSPTAKISDDVCIHPGAVIMDDVEIGCGSVIYPNVTVMENCVIGSHVNIFPSVTLYENTIVGDRCIIHAGAVLGAYGFGYTSEAGQHKLASQLGNVVLEADVEIGANTTIDRGSYDSTIIGTGTKLDDLVMVGHNTKVGQHNLLCSQVGIAGSCQTGDYVVMGGQVGMADHLNIGNNVSIGAQSGLMHDAQDGEKLFGSPARSAREEMQLVASRAKLPEMRKTIRKLEKQIETLTELVQSNAGLNRKDAA